MRGERDRVPGTLSIGRPQNAEADEKPLVHLTVKVGKRKYLVEMTAEDFALAVTGRSDVPVTMEATERV